MLWDLLVKMTVFWWTLLALFIHTTSVVSLYRPRQMKSYVGYKLVRSELVKTESQVDSLLMRVDGVEGLSLWTRPKVNASTYIFLSPDRFDYVVNIFSDLELGYQLIYNDANKLVQEENPYADSGSSCRIRKMNWIAYHRYKVIMDYLRSVARFSVKNSYRTIGKSYEGRDIGMVRIGTGNKPGIFISGGIHAREWITPAVATYIMDRLINDKSRKYLTDKFNWYFVPLINVDGYEYTHTTDRFWRKNRSKSNDTCYGVDLNRNWPFHWGDSPSPSSTDPCSDYYRGPRESSEAEIVSLTNALLSLRNRNIKASFNLHSFTQLWLLPWSYTEEKPKDYDEILRAALIGKSALENTYGTRYVIGTGPDILYPSTGGADDWIKAIGGIKYSYTLEMRDDGSKYGFNLPASQIKATGEETLNGIAAFANAI